MRTLIDVDPLVVILIVLVVVLAGAVLYYRAKGPQKPKRPAGVDPFSSADDDSVWGNPRTLKPGDLVTVRGQDYTVRGALRLSEGSYTWSEIFLDTGVGDKVWLSVEDDPDLEVALWREIKGVAVQPGPPSIELDGRRYQSDESGTARFVSEGTTGVAERGTVEYHDYESGDGTLLSFERFTGPQGQWEAARGERLGRADYTIYPQNNS